MIVDEKDKQLLDEANPEEVKGSKAIRRRNDDGLCAVRSQLLQHLPKAGAFVDTVGIADGLIVLSTTGQARPLGVSLDGSPLTLIAVFVGPNIGRA